MKALQVVMGAGLLEAEAMGWGMGDDEEGNGGAGVVPRGWNSTRPGEVRVGRDWAGVEDGEWRGELRHWRRISTAALTRLHPLARAGTYQFLDYQGFAHYKCDGFLDFPLPR